jgi:hypothetical protein
MVSSGLLRRMALLRTDVRCEEAPGSSETSVLTRATRRNNQEDTILHSHHRENLKSYMCELSFRTVGLKMSSLPTMGFKSPFFKFKSWANRTLLRLKLVGILTINLFLT